MSKINKIIEVLSNKGYDVERKEVRKNNVAYDAIIFKNENGICPTAYPTTYEGYETMSAEEIAEELIKMIENSDAPKMDMDINDLADYDKIKDKIFMEVVNAKVIDTDDIYIPKLNMGIRFRVLVSKDGQIASYLIKKKQAETWGVNTETLLDIAIENNLFPPVIKSMFDMISSMEIDTTDFESIIPDDSMNMYIITNKNNFKGAAVLGNYKFLVSMLDKWKLDKLIIIPSSVHEVIIPPQDNGLTPEVLREMITSVNSTEVAKEDYLCDDPLVFTRNGLDIFR